MIVVAGCPRSGTSMMTNTLIELLSDDGYSVIGQQFPQEQKINNANKFDTSKPLEGESDEKYSLRKFMIDRAIDNGVQNVIKAQDEQEKHKRTMEDVKKLNKHGFFECRYTVRGCSYHIGIEKIVTGKKIAKIVSQGLPNTDPRYITEGKIILMARNPREVAKSQEGLTHTPEVQKILDMDSDCKVHQPDMFMQVTLQGASWFLNSGIDPLVIDYDEYCADPSKYIDEIISYLGMGNKDKAMKVLDLSQKRSVSAGIMSKKFKRADDMYQLMLKKDWQGIVDMGKPKQVNNIQCVRMQMNIPETHCKSCIKGGEVAISFRDSAIEKDIPYLELPCVYECGAGTDIDHKLVEESIRDNHWEGI